MCIQYSSDISNQATTMEFTNTKKNTTMKRSKTPFSFSSFLKRNGPLSSKNGSSRRSSDATESTVSISDISTIEGSSRYFTDEVTAVAVPLEKKSVSFGPSVKARYTICRKEYTEEEMESTWYTREEYQDISKRSCKDLYRMERGEILKDVKYCSRGLESYTVRGTQSKMHNRRAAYVAVLGEQRSLCLDDECIADKYNSVSSSSQMWANAVALKDQIAAEAYLFDDC